MASKMKTVAPQHTVSVNLDLIKGKTDSNSLTFQQNDSLTRIIKIKLNNKLPMDFTGYTPHAFIKEPGGEIFSTTPTILDAKSGEIEIVITAILLGIPGSYSVQIALKKEGDYVLSFPHFTYSVVESIHAKNNIIPLEG